MTLNKIFATLFLFTFINFHAYEKPEHITYLHPAPGSVYPTNQPTLLVKLDKNYTDKLDLQKISFDVAGEKSGTIEGKIKLSGKTIIFKPERDLNFDERISVKFNLNISSGQKPYKYWFKTGRAHNFVDENSNQPLHNELQHLLDKAELVPETYGKVTEVNGVSVPSDFPVFKPSLIKDGIAPGKIFLNNWQGTPYIMIFENDGTPYFYQKVEERSRDFKLQPTGILTRRYNKDLNAFVGMDSSYSIIDTFKCTNGFSTDEHELYMLENGHYFLIGISYSYVDMRMLIEGGKANVTVKENHIQEFDENHNLVFEWLSNEHFEILDAVHEELKDDFIDYVHMNSIAVDYDGNIIISSRHLSEVSKIDRETGEFIWRLGGENNQFNFINDEFQISYQHHARPVKGKPGHYTIFDNGNYHSPRFSRAVEFKIDTLNMTAEKVWEFRDSPDKYSWWMGNAQRLDNGNTLINWANGSLPKATEITPDVEKVYEADFANYTHTYRTFRFDWENAAPKPYLLSESNPDRVTLIFNKFGDKSVEKYIIHRGRTASQMAPIDTTLNTFAHLYDFPANGEYYFTVYAVDTLGNTSEPSNIEKVLVNFVEPGTNYLTNGDFSSGMNSWSLGVFDGADASGSINDAGEYVIQIDSSGSEIWSVQLVQGNIPLIKDRKYRFEFDARADGDKVIDAKLERAGDPYENYGKIGSSILSGTMEHYQYDFTMENSSDYYARVVFNCGKSQVGNSEADVYIDNVSVKEIGASSREDEQVNPSSYKLFVNYPNPFNPGTTIKYSLPERSSVSIEVYNSLGEKIKKLIDREQEAGIHEIYFDASKLSSGVYFYVMKAGSSSNKTKVFSNKMILLK